MQHQQVYLLRHGETAWTLTGQHTSITDLPLTDNGREQIKSLSEKLEGIPFAKIYCSPLLRARETCEILGYNNLCEIDANLTEWFYGDYEGLTTQEIRKDNPAWTIFTGICPHGESLHDVSERADQLLHKIRQVPGSVALISSGHILRVIAARWLGLSGAYGKYLTLHTASLSILSYEREVPVIQTWNVT